MKINTVNRIIKEQFPEENQQFADQLGYIINPAFDQFSQALTKNIDFNNLIWDIASFKVTVDANGIPLSSSTSQIKNSAKGRIRGLNVIRAQSTSGTTYATQQPFISFTEAASGTLLTLNKITGLPANTEFELTVMLISS